MKIVRATQPTGPVEIDTDHPLGRHVLVAFNGTHGFVSRNRQFAPSAYAQVGTRWGAARYYPSSNYETFADTVPEPAELSVLLTFFKPTSELGPILDFGNTLIFPWGGDGEIVVGRGSTAQISFVSGESDTFTANMLNALLLTHDGVAADDPAGFHGWFNGIPFASVSQAATGAMGLAAAASLRIGTYSGWGAGAFVHVAIFDRDLSAIPNAANSLFTNPWQIYKPDQHTLFLPRSATSNSASFVARAYGPDGMRMNTGLRM